jgi:hypothetical protein
MQKRLSSFNRIFFAYSNDKIVHRLKQIQGSYLCTIPLNKQSTF